MQIQTHSEMHSIKTNMKSEILTLITVSKELKLAKPQEVLTVFLKSIKRALEDFAAQENVPLNQTVAIGDGANDLEMIKAAGLGIAFNAKPKVVAAADTTISTKDLAAVLPLMGINF